MTVRNRCPHRVALKAAYTLIPGVDKGRPCPNAVAGADGPCSTDWLFIGWVPLLLCQPGAGLGVTGSAASLCCTCSAAGDWRRGAAHYIAATLRSPAHALPVLPSACRPGKTAVLSDLPEMLWAFSAYVLNSAPRYYISRQTADAYLGAASELQCLQAACSAGH